jgi:hypothetical protein
MAFRMSRLTWSAAVISGLLSISTAAPVFAQGKKDPTAMSDAEKKKEAKKLFKDAQAKFKDGKYADALPLYQEADNLVPGAVPKFQVAQCQDKLGNIGEAVKGYEAFLATNPEADKHEDRIKTANDRLEALKKTPATVELAITPADAANLSVMVDGSPHTGSTVELSPGKHSIVVKADGYEEKTSEFDVGPGEKTQVNIALAAASAAVPVTPPPDETPAPPPPEEPEKEERSMVPAYVTLGLAGVGAVVGTIFGIMALGSKSDFEAEPTQELFDDTERNALIADMSFGVALTFGVTGVVLLLSGGDDDAETGKAAAPKTRGFITPYVGPKGGGAAASLTF